MNRIIQFLFVILLVLFLSLCGIIWSTSFTFLSTTEPNKTTFQAKHKPFPLRKNVINKNTMSTTAPKTNSPILLLSRQEGVEASCDVRGNLGPCNVVIQNPPGSDWIKDRWQAASDMGGTAIPGSHWIKLDFKFKILVSSVIIDWETAYARDYILQGRINDSDPWIPFYDGTSIVEKSR